MVVVTSPVPPVPYNKGPIDERDQGTADDWVSRHPSLVRLTGRHPFNCEPPLTDLMNAGFITPVPIQYVRNHGACPNIAWNEHRVFVSGNVPSEKTFDMTTITAMRPIKELPVTLVCAGNRRKELNMIKKSIGFSWGPSGHATSNWHGISMATFLKACGITEVTPERQHVCFAGPKGELPKGDDGTYESSLPLSMCLDPGADVMLAWKQNDEYLHPDHGFPIRLIVPGYIGGRMVKWLTYIKITPEESTNFYWYNDNRILPPVVQSPEQATAEGWWYKPEYIFNELNINSAISSPAHDERLVIPKAQEETGMYTLKGYAYTGGGRPITRVEVSLDSDNSWRLTDIVRNEKPTLYGKHWCWIFWSVQVPYAELLKLADSKGDHHISCRAFDSANNMQHYMHAWNLMAMGNNCTFKVNVWKEKKNGHTELRFEHPTEPGMLKGGWMGHEFAGYKVPKVVRLSVEDLTAAVVVAPKGEGLGLGKAKSFLVQGLLPGVAKTVAFPVRLPVFFVRSLIANHAKRQLAGKGEGPGAGKLPKFSPNEVARHDQPEDMWIIIDGKVLDVTKYLEQHPGGASSIVINGGTDCTEEFEAIHSRKAWNELAQWVIGEVGVDEVTNKSDLHFRSDSAAQIADSDGKHFKLRKSEDYGIKDLPNKMNTSAGFHQGPNIPRVDSGSGLSPTGLPGGMKRIQSEGGLLSVQRQHEPMVALHPKKKVFFPLMQKIYINDNTRIFRFKLPTADCEFGLPVGKHIMVYARINGKLVLRAYTPVSDTTTRGHFDLLIKVYWANEHPKFPEGGLMSQYFETLKIGDSIECKGPMGDVEYLGRGATVVNHGAFTTHQFKKIGMICGGTGITPMFQVIQAIIQEPLEARPEVYLICGNNDFKQCLLYEELENIVKDHPNIHVWHTLSNVPADRQWKYGKGWVNKEMIEAHCPPPGPETGMFLCGPPGMQEAAKGILAKSGHSKAAVIEF